MAQYARRAGLEPTKTLDLGNGVKLEMVLIPAGKFVMGTPDPVALDEVGFRNKIVTGQAVLAAGGSVLVILLYVVVIRAITKRQRPQFSLAYLVVMVLVAGIGVMGGTRWWEAERGLVEARTEYAAAMARRTPVEVPAHEVTLTKPYYMGRYEATQEQYEQIIGTNPSHFKGQNLPVEMVSWNDAQGFCRKVGDKTGLKVRLPTEAEWEHACRAGTRTSYYTGDLEADLDRTGWYDENSNDTTHPVGQKLPNAWGLYDAHGNVWEWVQDLWESYKAEPAIDPQGTSQYEYRVMRGGSFQYDASRCRSAFRGGNNSAVRNCNVGFRVAADVPSKAR